MRATYLGGPKHGETDESESFSERVWVDCEDGTKSLYAIKSYEEEGVGNRMMSPTHVWYAAANIEFEEFYRLQKSIPRPDID